MREISRLRIPFTGRVGKLTSAIRGHLAYTLYLNTYVLATIRVLGIAFGFFFWLLAARLIGDPERVGQAIAVISAATLLAGLSQLGLGYGLVRYMNAKDRNRLTNSALSAVVIASLMTATLFLSGIKFWSPTLVGLTSDLPALALFLVLLVVLALSQLLHWVFLAMRKPLYTLAKQLPQAILAILLLHLLHAVGTTYLQIVLTFTLSVAAGLLLGLFWLLPLVAGGFRPRLANPLSLGASFVGYSFPNYLVDQLQRAPDSLMILLLVNLLGPASGAYFFVAWSILCGLQALAGSVAMSLFAEGSHHPQSISQHARKAFELGLLLALALALGVVLLGKLILASYGPAYAAQGYRLLQFLAISLIPGVVLPIFLSVLRVRDHLSLLLLVSGLSFTSGTLLVYAGVTIAGLTGAGIGWLASRLLMLVCVIILWKRSRC